jgi:hypothetical protein
MASTSTVVMLMMLVTCSLVTLASSAQFYASGRYGKRDLSQRSKYNLNALQNTRILRLDKQEIFITFFSENTPSFYAFFERRSLFELGR